MNSFRTNTRIFWALLSRDMYVLKKRLISVWIDTAVVLFLEVILFGSLIPLMGLPLTMIAPLFIGSTVSQTFFKATSKAYGTISDIRFDRFIDYQITLPTTKKWLFLSIIASWVIEIFAGIMPFLVIGIITLNKAFSLYELSWLKGLMMLALTSITISCMTIGSAYYYEYSWFMNNIWPRRYAMFYTFCPFYFAWKSAFAFSPRIAQCILLNPFTYCVEGLRSAMLGTDQFISLWICITAMILSIAAFVKFFAIGIMKRLDPV